MAAYATGDRSEVVDRSNRIRHVICDGGWLAGGGLQLLHRPRGQSFFGLTVVVRCRSVNSQLDSHETHQRL